MGREHVRIFEVGVRDGLQNESKVVSTRNKLWMVQSLVAAGVKDLELGAFVRRERVPQMADTERLYKALQPSQSVSLWALVPNRTGLLRALEVGVTHIAIFTGATESFVKQNIGMSIRESLKEYAAVVAEGRRILGKKLKVRGYVSTAFGCPFEGQVKAVQALRVIEKLQDLGVDQISIGDTIGVATPRSVEQVIRPALGLLSAQTVAVHFHDTRGTALANTLRALDLGVRTVDSSAGGLGGCPFAPGAAGNLATEDLVYMLNGMGMHTGIDLQRLSKMSVKVSHILKHPLSSKYLQSLS